jgi:hypothetical protein
MCRGEAQYDSLKAMSMEFDVNNVIFLLHMHGVDRLLQYPMTIEKFVEKNQTYKQTKVYQ